MSDSHKDYPGWKGEPGFKLSHASCEACGKLQRPDLLWHGKTMWLCSDARERRLPELGCLRLMASKRPAARAEFEQWCKEEAGLPIGLVDMMNAVIGPQKVAS